ncbi:MAG: hypothetical protein JO110_28260, partial [Acetobacteraceae bacterium]|nr:hypothetical protein [Acetobacteraceae bacterium]
MLLAEYNYRRIWLWLCLGWIISSADRTITGRVITWMIQNKVAFMATSNPYALGGLIGSIFFAAWWLRRGPARPSKCDCHQLVLGRHCDLPQRACGGARR